MSITVTAANDAPVVTATAGEHVLHRAGREGPVDAGLDGLRPRRHAAERSDRTDREQLQAGDEFVFVDQSGITGTYNSGTGVLTLTGTASVSDYQAALRSVEFRNNTNDNPLPAKAIEFKANDGDADSAAATKNLAITGVNDKPVLDDDELGARLPGERDDRRSTTRSPPD